MSVHSFAGPAAERSVHPVVRADVEIAASPERVFDALTDPATLAGWLDGEPAAPDAPTDPRPTDERADPVVVPSEPGAGTRWDVPARGPDGRAGRVGGEYRVVERPRRLETTWAPSWEPCPSSVRFDLEPIDVHGVPGTRLTVTHTGSPLQRVAPPTALAMGGHTYLVWRGAFHADPHTARRGARAPARAVARSVVAPARALSTHHAPGLRCPRCTFPPSSSAPAAASGATTCSRDC